MTKNDAITYNKFVESIIADYKFLYTFKILDDYLKFKDKSIIDLASLYLALKRSEYNNLILPDFLSFYSKIEQGIKNGVKDFSLNMFGNKESIVDIFASIYENPNQKHLYIINENSNLNLINDVFSKAIKEKLNLGLVFLDYYNTNPNNNKSKIQKFLSSFDDNHNSVEYLYYSEKIWNYPVLLSKIRDGLNQSDEKNLPLVFYLNISENRDKNLDEYWEWMMVNNIIDKIKQDNINDEIEKKSEPVIEFINKNRFLINNEKTIKLPESTIEALDKLLVKNKMLIFSDKLDVFNNKVINKNIFACTNLDPVLIVAKALGKFNAEKSCLIVLRKPLNLSFISQLLIANKEKFRNASFIIMVPNNPLFNFDISSKEVPIKIYTINKDIGLKIEELINNDESAIIQYADRLS